MIKQMGRGLLSLELLIKRWWANTIILMYLIYGFGWRAIAWILVFGGLGYFGTSAIANLLIIYGVERSW